MHGPTKTSVLNGPPRPINAMIQNDHCYLKYTAWHDLRLSFKIVIAILWLYSHACLAAKLHNYVCYIIAID